MPEDMQVRLQQYLNQQEFQTLAPVQQRRYYLRTVSAIVAAVFIVAGVVGLTLRGSVGKPAQITAKSTHHTTNPAKNTYDYQSVLGFTPQLPAKLPAGVKQFDSVAQIVFNSDSPNLHTFTAEYEDRTGKVIFSLTESANYSDVHAGVQSYPPKVYDKKVSNQGRAIYVTDIYPTDGTLGGATDTPNAPDYVIHTEMFLNGVYYQLQALKNEAPEKQCIKLMEEDLVPYDARPDGITREYHSLANIEAAKGVFSYQIVVPQSLPKGYKLQSASGYQSTGTVSLPSTVITTNECQFMYVPGVQSGSVKFVSITEKAGSSKYSLPFWSDPMKIRSTTVQVYGNSLAWYDPSRHVVIEISGGDATTKATLVEFAKAMVPQE